MYYIFLESLLGRLQNYEKQLLGSLGLSARQPARWTDFHEI
jgi:hypothetical protein